MVTITTADGVAHTDLEEIKKIKVPRTPNTEMFYRILDNYIPKKKEDTA